MWIEELKKRYLPYLPVLQNYPLHLVVAYISAMISNVLFALSPVFLRTFINQSKIAPDEQHQIIIIFFMFSGLILGFLFDYNSVIIRNVLMNRVETFLRETHQRSSSHHSYIL